MGAVLPTPVSTSTYQPVVGSTASGEDDQYWPVMLGNAAGTPVREIVLEARDVAFGGSNPTLSFEPGERVRFVVRNTDPGILHSITLPGIDSRVHHVRYDEQVAFEVTMPRSGAFDYTCPQHAPKMQGRIVIESGLDPTAELVLPGHDD